MNDIAEVGVLVLFVLSVLFLPMLYGFFEVYNLIAIERNYKKLKNAIEIVTRGLDLIAASIKSSPRKFLGSGQLALEEFMEIYGNRKAFSASPDFKKVCDGCYDRYPEESRRFLAALLNVAKIAIAEGGGQTIARNDPNTPIFEMVRNLLAEWQFHGRECKLSSTEQDIYVRFSAILKF